MAQRNRVASNEDFLHQQSQNLLLHCDIQHLGSQSQLTAKPGQALRQLQVFCFVDRRHLKFARAEPGCVEVSP